MRVHGQPAWLEREGQRPAVHQLPIDETLEHKDAVYRLDEILRGRVA
jgi:hypothetical protein